MHVRKGYDVIELNIAFVIQLINFGILVLVLNIFLYKPIRKILSERRQVIEAARGKVTAVDDEVQAKMAQYEARLSDAKAEAGTRRADALKEAKAEETLLLEKARKEASEYLGTIKKNIAGEAAQARELLKSQADALSGDICEKILGRGL